MPRPNRYNIWDENEVGDFTRASGDAVCEICGELIRKHPYGRVSGTFAPNAEEWQPALWLTRLCNGKYVKL
jgi:hypothetical protein